MPLEIWYMTILLHFFCEFWFVVNFLFRFSGGICHTVRKVTLKEWKRATSHAPNLYELRVNNFFLWRKNLFLVWFSIHLVPQFSYSLIWIGNAAIFVYNLKPDSCACAWGTFHYLFSLLVIHAVHFIRDKPKETKFETIWKSQKIKRHD